MIELVQFPPNKSTINLSFFCLKVETYLKMAGFAYKSKYESDPRKAPKGKFPYIVDGNTWDTEQVHEAVRKIFVNARS